MSKMIRSVKLAQILDLKRHFFQDKHYSKTQIGVRVRPDANYYNIEYAKCVALKYVPRSHLSKDEIIRRIDAYEP